MQSGLEFEIADDSNLVKKLPNQPHRNHPNRPKNQNQSNRKRNQPKKNKHHGHEDKNDIRSPKNNNSGERRRRPQRGKNHNGRHIKSEGDLMKNQPGRPPYKPHSAHENRQINMRTPSPIHQSNQRQQPGSVLDGGPVGHPAGAVPQQTQTHQTLLNQVGANTAYVYPMQSLQNLQNLHAHQAPGASANLLMQPAASYQASALANASINPAGYVTPNGSVLQHHQLAYATLPTMQPHHLVQQQMFPHLTPQVYQHMNQLQQVQRTVRQTSPGAPGFEVRASSVSSYGSPGPSHAQLASLPGDDLVLSLQGEIQRLKDKVNQLSTENNALKQMLVHTRNEFMRLNQAEQHRQQTHNHLAMAQFQQNPQMQEQLQNPHQHHPNQI